MKGDKKNQFSNRAQYKENDVIGSTHWMNTLMGQLVRIGDYMNSENPKQYLIEDYGKVIKNIAMDLIEWRESVSVPVVHISAVIERLEHHARALKDYGESFNIQP
jgi:histidinol phosphatase-like PHP family hydrolase